MAKIPRALGSVCKASGRASTRASASSTWPEPASSTAYSSATSLRSGASWWASAMRAKAAGTSPAATAWRACAKQPLALLGMCRSSKARTSDSGCAPMKWSTTWLSLIRTTVGRLRTPNCAATSGCSSALTLASTKVPAYSCANCSKMGINTLHGAHQSAQKSTNTG